jgi:hypothetical protein
MSRRAGLFAAVTISILAILAPQARAQSASPDSSSAPSPLPPPDPVSIAQTPADFPRGRISGLAFLDIYYNVDGDRRHAYDAAGADSGQVSIDGKKSITKDLNGVLVRRVYFQLDSDLSYRFAARFRLETDSKSLTSDGKIGVFVKAAYLQAKSVFTRSDFFVGMINTPTFENSEEFWQYRAVEKTIADFRGVASSSDLGAELKGFADPNHHVGYALMVGAGTGQKPETDRYKRVYFTLPIRAGSLRLEPYADYQVVRVTPAAINNDQATHKVFAGYELRRTALGAEALDRVSHKGAGATEEARGFSVFARQTFSPSFAAFARFDLWNPNKRVTDRVDQQFWIAGVDWQPLKDVHVIPNLELLRYDAKGTAVAPAHDDVQARVTFYYRFAKPQS